MTDILDIVCSKLEAEDRFYNSASDEDQYIRSGIRVAFDVINDVKNNVKTKNGWFLCSEVKPKDRSIVLVTLENGYVREAWYECARFHMLIRHNSVGMRETQEFPHENQPFAWRPMPKGCVKTDEKTLELNACYNIDEKMNKILTIMKVYERTFDWSFNDNVHPAIAHAIYGVLTGDNCFLEEYNELLVEDISLKNVIEQEEMFSTLISSEDRMSWTYCSDKMPQEHKSKYYLDYFGTDCWDDSLPKECSDDVLALLKFENNEKKCFTLHTEDGKWCLSEIPAQYFFQNFEIIAWRVLPIL